MRLGYQVKQDRVHQEVIQILDKPMSAKQIADIRGNTSTSMNTLLKVMCGKGLVKKHSRVKHGNHYTTLWVLAEKKVINTKPKSVFEFNLMQLAS